MVKKAIARKNIRKTLGLIAGLTKQPSTAREYRGFAAEEKALKAANYWQKKKLILKVRQTRGLSSEDREMKDLILTLLNGKEIAVEVKNYCTFLVVQKCRKRGVLLFSIWQDEDEEIAKERMLNLIISAYISISKLTPFQIRQLISKIWEIKELPQPLERPSLLKRMFSQLRKTLS